ncbi:MAG: hypothetical protein A2W36_06740 [Chloroflexi bacterium RBG_16_58_14]|nr:MAG: hypothetical protein A2W36_06740 [Chloroflexi bacterium RBG_16_58_14]
MFKRTLTRPLNGLIKTTASGLSLTLLFLLIEFFDELNYAIEGAVLPVMRVELALSYAQVGLLIGLPHVVSTLIEPAIMLLGDTNLRKRLIIAGGLGVAIAMFLIATAAGFPAILLATVIGFPASGAFVTLSQATLMDLNQGREPQMMARWTVAGSLGNLFGPLFVAAGFALVLGWRWVFAVLAVLALLLTLFVLFPHFPARPSPTFLPGEDSIGARQRPTVMLTVFANLREALGNAELLRWIVLLQFSDLLLDVFIGYAPLFLTDVVGVTPVQASLLLSVLMLTSLVADVALLPILERFPGRTVVRASAAITAVIYVTWLLVPWPFAKIALMILLRFSTLGWYQVLQGEAYASAPGRSGTVMAIGSVIGLLGGGMAWFVGWVASQAGLPAAMWLLLFGPVFLVLFVPRSQLARQ